MHCNSNNTENVVIKCNISTYFKAFCNTIYIFYYKNENIKEENGFYNYALFPNQFQSNDHFKKAHTATILN